VRSAVRRITVLLFFSYHTQARNITALSDKIRTAQEADPKVHVLNLAELYMGLALFEEA
jgi:hypothetical protein